MVLLFHQAEDALLFRDPRDQDRRDLAADKARSAGVSHDHSSCLVVAHRIPGRSHRRIGGRARNRTRLGIAQTGAVGEADTPLLRLAAQVSAQPVQHRDAAVLEIRRCMPSSESNVRSPGMRR
jgi:hypothetical protein